MNKKIIIISIITLLIDQITKNIIQSYYKIGQCLTIIKKFINICYVNNYGAAWSILNNKSFLLIVVSLIALIIIYRFMYIFKSNKRNNIAFGLLLGGILGNLIDRIFLGYVRDFIDMYIFSYDYPVFNVADIAVVIGVILLIVAIIKGEDGSDKVSSGRK